MGSKEWLLKNLNMTEAELYSKRRNENTSKRWVMIWFYRVAGKSYTQIARILRKDQSTCRHACVNASITIKRIAEEYFCRYMTEVKHEVPDFKIIEPEEKKKVVIKVPDYHNNIIVEKEVDADKAVKKIRKISRWDL